MLLPLLHVVAGAVQIVEAIRCRAVSGTLGTKELVVESSARACGLARSAARFSEVAGPAGSARIAAGAGTSGFSPAAPFFAAVEPVKATVAGFATMTGFAAVKAAVPAATASSAFTSVKAATAPTAAITASATATAAVTTPVQRHCRQNRDDCRGTCHKECSFHIDESLKRRVLLRVETALVDVTVRVPWAAVGRRVQRGSEPARH
jgi:hypothetical protein